MWSNVATDTNYTLSINNQQTSNKGLICNDNDESIENNLLCKCHDITRQHSYLFMIVIIIEIKSNSNNNGDQLRWHLTACLHWQFQLNIWKNVKDEWLLDSRCEADGDICHQMSQVCILMQICSTKTKPKNCTMRKPINLINRWH